MPDPLLSLVLFAIVATGTPGAATALATASGVRFGFRRSIPAMAGCAFGLSSVAATAAAGLGALLQAAPTLQLAMKVAGSAYLLWLAWRIGRSGSPRRADAADAPAGFVSGVLLLWLTPKGWSTSLAAAASFAALGAGPLGFALLLAATLGLTAAVSLCLWCAAGLVLARTLRTDRQWRMVNAGLGLVLAISVLPMWMG